jgi:hypothetical protein|tara:strand:- start:181 stop:978 length:798 start_codon:yes stop_codon:yes gene_type:complete
VRTSSIEINKTTEQAKTMAQHSKHPPSSLYRDLGGCTGWSSLAQEVEQPKANFAAFLGTAVHEISETILKDRIDNLKVEDYWLGKTMMVEDVEINIEQEHCDWAKFYTDYVNKREKELEAEKYIERKVYVTEINKDLYGTADIILVGKDIIEVIDLKTGTWPVSPDNYNPQLSTYALGALAEFNIEDPKMNVMMTIVQPRAKEPVRSWTCSVEDLTNWGFDVLKPALDEADSESPVFAYSVEGCRFCPAKSICDEYKKNTEVKND